MTCTATRHGTMTAKKTAGCTCVDADRATMRYEKRLRAEHARGVYRLVDVTGSRRRLQALCAIGYSQPDLARRLKVSQARVWQYLAGPRPTMRRATVARIAVLYKQLADTPSSGPCAGRTRRTAQRNGWLPPLWWDDDTIDDPTYQPSVCERPRPRTEVDPVVVERLADGVPVDNPTPAERFAAFQRLRVAGATESHIIRRLHLSWDTLASYRRRADAAGIARDVAA